MCILTVTLNPAIDRLVRVDRFFAGQDHRALSDVSYAGGKGVNVARALRALGVQVKAIGIAGGMTGRMLKDLIHEEGLVQDFLCIHAPTRINTTIMDGAGRVTRVMEQGPQVTMAERTAFKKFLLRLLKGCSLVVFCGSLPPGMDVVFFTGLIREVQGAGIPVAVDTGGEPLKAALKLGVDLIKPNRWEAESVLGFPLNSKTRIRKALLTFAGCGIKKVLISLGEDGLAAFDGLEDVFLSVPVIAGGHAVGCGDASLAGFMAAQRAGKALRESVVDAAACGVANAQVDAPGGISRKAVRKWGREILLLNNAG